MYVIYLDVNFRGVGGGGDFNYRGVDFSYWGVI